MQERKLDSLGGSAMASMLAAFRFDLPFKTLNALGVQGQVFLNAGTLGNFLEKGEKASISRNLKQSFRSSVGAGLLWPLKIGQLELNVCRVLSNKKDDYPKHGLQFGITPY
jgi:outer membrane protein insertion porin family